MKTRRSVCAWVIVMAALAGFSLGGETPKEVRQSSTVVQIAIVAAIDYTNRVVTVKYDDGNVETFDVSPEVQRFDALRVGDKVTFRQEESTVYRILKPGASPKAPETRSTTPLPGAKPGGVARRELTTVVTVESIDPKAPSITVTLEDGSRKTFAVKKKKNLKGVKPGDRVEITYTQATMISVESPGK